MGRVKCFMLVPVGGGLGRVYDDSDRVVDRCTQDEWNGPGRPRGGLFCPLYRRVDTGEEMSFKDAPPGAMAEFEWGLSVKLPNGRTWNIDGEANNCTRKGDRSHRCWCRHGTPPEITVDKTPEPGGQTCAAGGGSIGAGDYHGFLRGGFLESC